jgi:hypothetical protein
MNKRQRSSQNGSLSEDYLEKLQRLVSDRWQETQQAMEIRLNDSLLDDTSLRQRLERSQTQARL